MKADGSSRGACREANGQLSVCGRAYLYLGQLRVYVEELICIYHVT